MKWISIDKLGEYVKGNEMFVVKAFDVHLGKIVYTSDPWCVWVNDIDEFMRPDDFIRWPHLFMPTHFCLLPEEREE
jgi:hypothetical protein